MATLSGKWTLRAIGNEAGWTQGVRITGSLAHDGDHVMLLGSELPHVEGGSFTVTPQALNPATNVWIDSLEQEQFGWDDQVGLTLTISADDNPPGDLDFNDLVLLCLAEDDALVSPNAGIVRPDLTIPENLVDFER
jgi:hypothetical protein